MADNRHALEIEKLDPGIADGIKFVLSARQRAIDAVAVRRSMHPTNACKVVDAIEDAGLRLVVEALEAAGLRVVDGDHQDAARNRIVEAGAILWHHGDADDPRCTQDGNQALRAVHSAFDALTPGGDFAAAVRAREGG